MWVADSEPEARRYTKSAEWTRSRPVQEIKTMKIIFLHPTDSLVFPAEVDPDTTGKTCTDNLVAERFIEPPPAGRPYAMAVQRSQRQVLPQMTMQEAGVQDKDALVILQQEQGAG